MIPQAYLTEWQQYAPWPDNSMVEQDLVICRALVEIFRRPILAEALAFRGGTALFKLHMSPARYSEDIDLVQVEGGPIGPILTELRGALDSWLGEPKRKSSDGGVTMLYRFTSEDGLPMRLKVEMNTREHFSLHGLKRQSFAIDSRWFAGQAEILTYSLDELLGTKMRALYQRKKGRDLFDLWYAFNRSAHKPDAMRLVDAFLKYMERGGHHVTRATFEENLLAKRSDPRFTQDISLLLAAGVDWDFDTGFEFVMNALVALLPGEPWHGRS